jgi:hypothetical protein
MNKRFLELLRAKFEEGLARKTGWGKNEVLHLFEQCVGDAAVAVLDEVRENEPPF